jgi:hypothetical protein
MVTELQTPVWIRVEAPDAASAFALEQRLAHLHPSAVGRGRRWCVEFEDFDERREEIEAGIRYWLQEIGVRSTVLYMNKEMKTVTAEPRAEEALGSGYNGVQVLEHEP